MQLLAYFSVIRKHLITNLMPFVRAKFIHTRLPVGKILAQQAQMHSLNKNEVKYMRELLDHFINLALVHGEYPILIADKPKPTLALHNYVGKDIKVIDTLDQHCGKYGSVIESWYDVQEQKKFLKIRLYSGPIIGGDMSKFELTGDNF